MLLDTKACGELDKRNLAAQILIKYLQIRKIDRGD